MKNTVKKSKLSTRSPTTLFDSLIKPIVLYGAPIFTPTMSILKHIAKLANNQHANSSDVKSSILNKISLLNCEKVHLHFLKWALGVNKKACNAGVWGELGRYPLVFECINLTLNYVQRLQNLKDDSLVHLAFLEQKNLNLNWYKGLVPLLKLDPCYSTDHVTAHHILHNRNSNVISPDHSRKPPKENFLIHNGFKKRLPPQTKQPNSSGQFTPHVILKAVKTKFKDSWTSYVNSSRKLEFYKAVKSKFAKESYLEQVPNYTDRANMARLRISAHRLEIEVGRYTNTPREKRICAWCKIVLDKDTVENESHLLNECDLNAQLRRKTTDKINSILNSPTVALSIPPQTVTDSTNHLLLLCNRELLEFLTTEIQVHPHRTIARFITNLL